MHITTTRILLILSPLLAHGIQRSPVPEDSLVCSRLQTTFPSVEAAHTENNKILHCGNCGKCSNSNDVSVYLKTTYQATAKAKECAIGMVFRSKKWGTKCMTDAFGFTSDCTECWIQNIQCSKKNCGWTCVKSLLWPKFGGNQSTETDDCLKCDEERCGPAFKKCSGANRRRLGIKSDIDRDDREICKVIDRD